MSSPKKFRKKEKHMAVPVLNRGGRNFSNEHKKQRPKFAGKTAALRFPVTDLAL